MERLSIFLVSLYSLHVYASPFHIPFSPDGNVSTTSSENVATVQCDTRYGVNLDIQDCRNAISHFNSGSDLLTLANRENIMPGDQDTLPLPFRLMGSKSIPHFHPNATTFLGQARFSIL